VSSLPKVAELSESPSLGVFRGLGCKEEAHLPQDDSFIFSAATPSMVRLRAQIEQVARFDVPVVLRGESGSGKEVVARLIHRLSGRSRRKFLKLNCAAIPGELLESELFGYEAGAFTGALRSKPGLLELGHKGTILLDEIGEVPFHLQAKLLQALQDKEFSRLGGQTTVYVDARLIAATNINIEEAIVRNQFRADLYYRLGTFSFLVPPLRERPRDIPPLLNHFMRRISAAMERPPENFSSRVIDACLRYPWPGNVRELENFVLRYLILGDEEAALAGLNGNVQQKSPGLVGAEASSRDAHGLKARLRGLKEQAEKEAILVALKNVRWNRTEAARQLKISSRALRYKIQKYGLHSRRLRATPFRAIKPEQKGHSSGHESALAPTG
jgi:two-component system, NtrC family, response regulator AtoC